MTTIFDPPTTRATAWQRLRLLQFESEWSLGRFRLAAVGQANIWALLTSLTDGVRSHSQRIHVALPFDPAMTLPSADELLVSAYAISQNPLLTSLYPHALVAPVPGELALFDHRYVALAGSPTPSGAPTLWVSHDPETAVLAEQVWQDARAAAQSPRCGSYLSERQLAVARLMATGETTRRISRELGYSERTVERELESITAFLGAPSRTAAIAAMMGSKLGRTA
ncbi:MAG TPA: helix-turn-helix transcriptional regulator [Marmoricola sp.]|nr:helix-turn-helix transcriptional regulator [Marmoricola sp.]